MWLWLALVACVGDIGEGKERAQVVENARPAAQVDAGSGIAVDQSQSALRVLAAKVSGTIDLGFDGFQGEIGMDGEEVAWVRYEVDASTVTSPHDRLTAHLKNSDFLDVPNHPTSTFASTAIRPKVDGDWTHEVEGDLAIRGITKRVTFPSTIEVASEGVKAHAEFTVDRTWFGITYEGKKDDLIQDSVVLSIDLVAPRGG